MQTIANLAHASADRLIAVIPASQIIDPVACGQVAAACSGYDPTGREGGFFVERFAGHIINVACGTAGL